ncbi:hypothetical protein PG985_002958 [Apiospora marii]|uniref:uncharacterized protein n=1 Tax=Apiospora marii TaxID=335849 RepID=UPI00312D76C2
MVVSDDKPRRKEAFEKIKGSKILTNYPGYELGHCEVAAEHEDLHQLGNGNSILRDVLEIPTKDVTTAQPPIACVDIATSALYRVLSKPTSLYFRDGLDRYGLERKTCSVTSSGLFTRNKSYFIITAAHVLRSPQSPGLPGDGTIDESGGESDDFEITGIGDWDSDNEDETFTSTTSLGSRTSSSAGSDNEERLIGHKPLRQSSPSVPTVPEENTERTPGTHWQSSAEERAILGYDSYVNLGPVVSINDELDLALVRLLTENLEIEGRPEISSATKTLHPQGFCSEGFWEQGWSTGSPITVLTASKGPIPGKQSSMPFYTRLPGAHDFHLFHSFHLETPLSAGDSGSWVVGGPEQELIGFVVAGSPKTGVCLVCLAKRAIESFDSLLYEREKPSAADLSSMLEGQTRNSPIEDSPQQPQSDDFRLQEQGTQHKSLTESPADKTMDYSRELQPTRQEYGFLSVPPHRTAHQGATRPSRLYTPPWQGETLHVTDSTARSKGSDSSPMSQSPSSVP